MAMSSFSNKLVSRASHVLKQISAPTFTTVATFYSKDEEGGHTITEYGSRGHLPPAEMCETDEALQFRIKAPGLSGKDVKVTVRENQCVIKAGADVDSPTSCRFEAKLDLSEKPFKIKEAKSELNDGMLYVYVPKVKDKA